MARSKNVGINLDMYLSDGKTRRPSEPREQSFDPAPPPPNPHRAFRQLERVMYRSYATYGSGWDRHRY